ncbi:hypothetical protein M409DRAFT_17263 [Zasmidium cellare ATCC 36951]|uniref:Enoyl-CoA hydratase n=1 Tax=Zasmidium cellare ATCC 36951 TaxID=1080233 RepID=A0A6A6D2K6_ZASCE|nr:uncharacterized protein M409DRAFT_17263 [Zasmidium cellare ATCC 36951]KAF2173323.1 hypothetical protein M409DRAFT_17263 [Zasmidium cellare ATCC 36951]
MSMKPSTSTMTMGRALMCRGARSWRSGPICGTVSRAFAIHSLTPHARTTGAKLLFHHQPRLYSTSSSKSTEPSVSHTLHDHSPNAQTATITISNPSKLNILNSTLLDQLTQTCTTLSTNPSLRAVVLTGGPTKNSNTIPSFIGGADIKEMHALTSPSSARAFILKVHAACQALRALPVPVIAKIDEFCLGAGLEIAVSCDLRIATERSSFAMPEVRVGIPSVVEAALLPGLIGMGRTRRLLYLAESIGAVEAERWGLVERVVGGEGELEAGVEEWVEGICGMGPKAIRSQKKLMLGWENSSVEEGIQAGVEAFTEAYEDGEEPREFMRKFVNRKR